MEIYVELNRYMRADLRIDFREVLYDSFKTDHHERIGEAAGKEKGLFEIGAVAEKRHCYGLWGGTGFLQGGNIRQTIKRQK